ncbi:GntR family transcriptional regulator [Corynebacterium sp.]|uniref:GntR family transcriptional regulator n=1 Tax=Corynebacterium sp. TaxID=1720 RepID=UPI0025C21EDE|nr:GntR family transcriptional regulator [Corynebacterium sp.]
MRAQTAAQQLRLAVSAGEFTPGQKLSEVAVAQRFGISRNTLRESYAMLIADGVLERVPNRGVFIAAPGAGEVRNLYLARAVVEPGALLWGATPDVDALGQIVAEAETHRQSGDLAATAAANQEFHRTVVAAAGSALLNEEMERLLARMRLVFLQAERHDPGFHGGFVEVNRAVVSLLQTGGREEAATLLRTSLLETSEALSALIG